MLLGGFDVYLNGRPVTGFAYNKMRALLAYLAVEREQDHKREALAELLWSDYEPAAARNNLRRTLADLRRALESPSGKTMFSAGKHTIRFIPNGYIDVLDFVRQQNQDHDERIIALYRGEFLAGLSLPDSPDFEDWLQIQREALHRRSLALLELLSDRHQQSGDYGKALPFALRQTELVPWDEDALRRAMRLYALNGQSSAALHQYEVCCRLLKKELGALPSEETRHLSERIRNGELQGELPDAMQAPMPNIVSPSPAERRQATVLYCELIPMMTDDPDEAMERLDQPQARCMEVIRQFSGHIVQTYGGGLLAYFGYPQAHEYAARLAVQAALVITRTAAHGIDIRVSVHTGLIITDGAFMPDTAGMTSRLPALLRDSAAPNEVTISRETHCLVAGYFDCISLGVQVFPGFPRAMEVFKVLGDSGARSRLEAAAQLTPLVGRKAEIAELMRAWEKSTQGFRQIVLVQAEAGIGKSRLLHTLKLRLADRPHANCELRCFPEFSQSPFYPLIAMLEDILGFVPSDSPGVKFGKLVGWLEQRKTYPTYPESAQLAVPLLANLLSLPLGEHYQQPDLSPQKQKERTITILLDLLQALAVQQPVLLIVEDLHWVDPSTLELLTLCIEQEVTGAILGVFTARPEFVPPWKRTLVSTLALAPLLNDEVAEIIASLSGDISAATLCRIVERADGVPLFAEEMAKIASLDNQVNIPATLHDLLTVRMDNMGEAKYTAQLAATIGREFVLDLLLKVSPLSAFQLRHSLDQLQDAGLVFNTTDAVFQFKHALIQEAAYQSQARADRQAAHRRIVYALLADFPDVVETKAEIIAQHLDSAGEFHSAIDYWLKAGQHAIINSAIEEAIAHFNAGLQRVMTLPPDNTRDRLESELRLNLGTALIAAKGYGSVEAGEAYARALALVEPLADQAGVYQALWGMWLTSSSRIGHLHSLELAEKLLSLAECKNDPLPLQQALYAMGNSLLWTGQLEKSRLCLERSIALYQSSHHHTMVSVFGENIRVSCGAQLSWVLWLLGFPDRAQAVGTQTMALAHELNHPYSLCYARLHYSELALWMRQIEKVRQLAEENIMQADRHGFPLWLLLGSVMHGWALSMQGVAAGIAPMQEGLDIVRGAMSGIEAYFLGMLCEACFHLGRWEESLSALNQTLDVMNAKDDRFLQSEALRLKGECLLKISAANMEEAEACFSQALSISRRQEAKSLELRATVSMARLWLQQGKQEEARQSLEDIYCRFTEGFCSPDLQEVTELLALL
jgi:DNA-binding SARP family transcriptional activator/tetratricopeptide (TPR) repeat protein